MMTPLNLDFAPEDLGTLQRALGTYIDQYEGVDPQENILRAEALTVMLNRKAMIGRAIRFRDHGVTRVGVLAEWVDWEGIVQARITKGDHYWFAGEGSILGFA